VLIDFGLCVGEEDTFRKSYCRFWKAMFERDTEGMKDIVRGWGVGNEDVFASMTLGRPYSKEKPIDPQYLSKKDMYDL
jgi:aarF domain-containing kinase